MSNDLQEIVFYTTILLIIINYFLGFIMLKKTMKIKLKITKKYFLGLVLFLFVHATCRIFYFVYDFYYSDELIWWEIGAILGLLSITLLIAAVESTIFTKSKHALTIIGISGLILMTIQSILNVTKNQLPINLSQIVQYGIVSILALTILLIYIYVTIKSTGNIRKSSLLMTIGIILFELGQIAHTSTARELFPISVVIGPIVMITALILLYIAISQYYTE
ncbi:MAG: hypothetical protein ACTSQJ_13645 [Promethearchaeota archaeon]